MLVSHRAKPLSFICLVTFFYQLTLLLWFIVYLAAGTETIALQDGDKHRLYGYKWFTSAVDANMALTLARSLDENGQPIAVSCT